MYAIGIAHKGSFHRLTMANLLRRAQQTRNSHKKARHSHSGIQMAEELPLQRAREAGSTDSRLHHVWVHDVACSVSYSRDMTNQMQRRAAVKGIATTDSATSLEINNVHTNAHSISYKYLQTQTMTNNRQVQLAIHNTPTRSLQHTHCCIAVC